MITTPLDDWISVKTGASDYDTLRAYQLEKLRGVLAYVKSHSRYYSKHLSNIEPAGIQAIEDAGQIPFTTSDMLIESPLDFVCVAPDDIGRIITIPTSGTTAPPKRIFFTADDQELTLDFFHHGMMTLAAENDRVLIFLPGKKAGSIGDLLARALERFDCRGIIHGPVDDYTEASRALATAGATCAVGLPAQLFALSRFCPGIKLKSVLLCSDHVSASITHALECAWDCEVFSHYGMIESGLGGGVDCRAHTGYHMREADILFEIVDPVSGEPIPDGESGEIVFTTLTRRGMPLIRYKTGDFSRVLTDPCPCGSWLRRFDCVSGRVSGIVETGNGCKISVPALDEILFAVPGLIGFSAEAAGKAGADTLMIAVFAENYPQVTCEAERRLREDDYIGNCVKQGFLKLELRQGGPEILTYGNTKRSISRNSKVAVQSVPGSDSLCPAQRSRSPAP